MKSLYIALFAISFTLTATAQIGQCGGVKIIYTNETAPTLNPIGPFNINPEYHNNITTQQEAVIEFAVQEWNEILETNGVNPGNYKIEFRNGPIESTNILATAFTTFNSNTGNLIKSEVIINDSPLINWYIDASPENDSEFNDGNSLGTDFLSVIRHEIGHAVGWINHNHRIDNLVNEDQQGNILFDGGNLHIGLNFDTAHTSPIIHPNDLMNPAISPGIRRGISIYPDAAFLSKAFEYEITKLRCIHPSGSNLNDGHVFAPWKTFEKGIQSSPSNFTLLIYPGVYIEDLPLARLEGLLLQTTRAGSAVIQD